MRRFIFALLILIAGVASPAVANLQVRNFALTIVAFNPGVPANAAFIRIGLAGPLAIPAGASFTDEAGTTWSPVCIAKEAATGSTTVTINQISGGVTTAIGTLVWSASGTTCAVTFSAAVDFAAGDMIEFAFPATADATLGDIAISLPGYKL